MSKRLLILAAAVLPLILIAWALVAPDTTEYSVVEEADGYELRRYEPYVVAEVRARGTFDDADEAGFGVLIDYIKGANEGGRHLPMTAPVRQRPLGDTAPDAEQEWLLQFVMSPEYLLSMLPRPADQAVTLRQAPGGLVAARRYRGNWREAKYREQQRTLLAALRDAGLEPVGTPAFARYNAPIVPGFLRRNEVLVEVVGP